MSIRQRKSLQTSERSGELTVLFPSSISTGDPSQVIHIRVFEPALDKSPKHHKGHQPPCSCSVFAPSIQKMLPEHQIAEHLTQLQFLSTGSQLNEQLTHPHVKNFVYMWCYCVPCIVYNKESHSRSISLCYLYHDNKVELLHCWSFKCCIFLHFMHSQYFIFNCILLLLFSGFYFHLIFSLIMVSNLVCMFILTSCEARSAFNIFLEKHYELQFLYERCYTNKIN